MLITHLIMRCYIQTHNTLNTLSLKRKLESFQSAFEIISIEEFLCKLSILMNNLTLQVVYFSRYKTKSYSLRLTGKKRDLMINVILQMYLYLLRFLLRSFKIEYKA